MSHSDSWRLWHWKDMWFWHRPLNRPAKKMLRRNQRQGGARAYMEPDPGDTVKSAAQFADMEPSESAKWLKNERTGRWVSPWARIDKCSTYSVPNTFYVTKGRIVHDDSDSAEGLRDRAKEEGNDRIRGPIVAATWRFNVGNTSRRFANEMKFRGFKVVFNGKVTKGDISSYFMDQNIYGLFYGGHGDDSGNTLYVFSRDGESDDYVFHMFTDIHHKLGSLVLYNCYSGRGDWNNMVSIYGTLRTSWGKCRPAFRGWKGLDESPGGGSGQ